MNKDIELQVWKDLATTKQVLMTAVIETLGVDPNCTPGDLRLAINLLVERSENAKNEAERSKTLCDEANDKVSGAVNDQLIAEMKLEEVKGTSAEALNKAKDLVNQKQRELKAINKILSDSPENVVKKMKKLKQKNIEQSKHTKEVERNFKDAVSICERLKHDIEERTVEIKGLKAEVNKLTPIITE